MKIKLQLFGAFRKYSNEIDILLPQGSVIADLRSNLLNVLADKDLGLDKEGLINSSRFANDEAILNEDSLINEHDTLAILPPVSGG